MKTIFSIFIGKIVFTITQLFHFGAGGTWPGEIILKLYPQILSSLIKQLNKGVIVISGTNGKTTTALMVSKILEADGQNVIHNSSGANLLNGIVSAFIQKSSWFGKINADWGVLEVDENVLPIILNKLSTQNSELRTIIVLLNLFRDQLDRYGEVDVIIEKWQKALRHALLAQGKLTLILNADDPGIAGIGKNVILEGAKRLIGSNDRRDSIARQNKSILFQNDKIYYFGIDDSKLFLKSKEHTADSSFCTNCGHKLNYQGVYYSHIGIWKCDNCKNSRPQPDLSECISPLPGLYNKYNTLAAISVTRLIQIKQKLIEKTLMNFKPVFGRQEEFIINNKKIKIFLSKNPTGFNASLRTILEFKPKTLLLSLNDRIPDGRDVSWIYDVDFEIIPENIKLIITGDRVYDLALRIKYSRRFKIYDLRFMNLNIEPNSRKAIEIGLNNINKGETLYILPTYSAMLDIRKILIGRRI